MCSGRAQAVLPLGGAVLPLSTVKTAQTREKTRDFGPGRYYRLGATVVLLWRGTTAQEQRYYRSGAVVKNYIRSSRGSTAAALTKTTTTFANRLRIQRNQVCWKANDMG